VKFIFFGIAQGLTEFLPISSSGHLYILKKYLYVEGDLLPFFVFLHLATLLAICVFLHKEILFALSNKNVLIHISIVTAITAVFGLCIDHFLKDFFESRYLVALLLIVNAGIILSAKNISQKRDCSDIKAKDSIIVGVLQGLAVFPGISRSGITIVTLLKRGFKAKEAFSLSFLMAIPIILGSFLLKFKELFHSNVSISSMAGGFIFAFFFGLLGLLIVKKTLMKEGFNRFGYYCIVIAFLSLLY